MSNSNISPDDLRAKLTELKDGVEVTAGGAEDAVKKGAILGGIILLLLVFFLGSRRGKAGRTVVEVRRI